MRALLLFALVAWPTVTWACDDGAPKIAIVGTLKGDRLLVRDERYDAATITLYLLDLKRGKTVEFATILDARDNDEDPAKVRAARWKAAEAKLKKEGLVLQTFRPMKLPATIGEVTFRQASTAVDAAGCGKVVLEATRGAERVQVDSTGSCGASDVTDLGGLYEIDGYVIPLLSSGCLNGPDDWMHAFKLADLFKPQAK